MVVPFVPAVASSRYGIGLTFTSVKCVNPSGGKIVCSANDGVASADVAKHSVPCCNVPRTPRIVIPSLILDAIILFCSVVEIPILGFQTPPDYLYSLLKFPFAIYT
mgnify:CR=1 FL=1